MAAPSPKRARVQGRGALPFPLPRLLARDLFRLIRSVHGPGVSILLVEQNGHQALQIADRGYVAEKGEVSLVGTGEESLRDEYVRKAFWG